MGANEAVGRRWYGHEVDSGYGPARASTMVWENAREATQGETGSEWRRVRSD